MFCPNCGTQVPDDANNCGNCGYRMVEQQPQQPQQPEQPEQPAYQQPAYQQPAYQQPAYQQPAYQQPVYQQPVYQQPMYQQPYQPVPKRLGPPISKKEFLKTAADESTKKTAGMITITFVLTLVLLLSSIIAPLAMSVFEIPVVALAISKVDDADVDGLMETMEEAYDDAREVLDHQGDYMSKDEREVAEKVLDAMEKTVENYSILNYMAFISVADNEGSKYMSIDKELMAQVQGALVLIIAAVVFSFLLPIILSVIAGATKSMGVTIAAVIFTVISQLVLCGTVFVVLSILIYGAQIFLCNKVGKAHKAYRAANYA